MGFGLRCQGWKNIFFPVSEPAQKGGRKIPGAHGWTILISARIRGVQWQYVSEQQGMGFCHNHPIFPSSLCRDKCDVVEAEAKRNSLLPLQKFSAGNPQVKSGLSCRSRANWIGLVPTWAGSQLLGGWPGKPFPAWRAAEGHQLRLLLSFLYFQTLSEPGTKQCCMPVPMQTLLHSF